MNGQLRMMAENIALIQPGLINLPHLRLSCQIVFDHDMELRAISRL